MLILIMITKLITNLYLSSDFLISTFSILENVVLFCDYVYLFGDRTKTFTFIPKCQASRLYFCLGNSHPPLIFLPTFLALSCLTMSSGVSIRQQDLYPSVSSHKLPFPMC